MKLNDKEIDELIKKSYEDIKVPDEIFNEAYKNLKNDVNKTNVLKYICGVAAIITAILIMVITSIIPRVKQNNTSSIPVIDGKNGEIDVLENSNIDENNISEEHTEYKTYSYITDEMRLSSHDSKPVAMFRHEYTPEYMLELSDLVALVTIVTIDGASTEYNSMFGMTYGSLLIEDIIVGDNIEKDIVGYIKPGGILTMSNWEKTQPQTANDKRNYLSEKSETETNKDDTYINIKLGNDIELEAGKTYLAYLNYNEKFDKYEIIGLGNGLREVNVEQQINSVKKRKIKNNKDLKIKNNTTGQWESLDTYIVENINNIKE